MSNKNYNKMYKSTNATEEEEQLSFVSQDTTAVEDVEPIEETVTAPTEPEAVEVCASEPEKAAGTASAIVINCAKLNVREEPSPKACIVAVIDASNEVVIYGDEGFGNYYKVCTASGIEGYCIKDFLELK